MTNNSTQTVTQPSTTTTPNSNPNNTSNTINNNNNLSGSTLTGLKAKWFLDLNATNTEAFPPVRRFNGSKLASFTDNNEVTPLIDGRAVMTYLYEALKLMMQNPTNCEFWIVNWRITKVRPKGTGEDFRQVLLGAAEAGVKVYFLGSGDNINNTYIPLFYEDVNGDFVKLLAAKPNGFARTDTRCSYYASQHQKFYVLRNGTEWSAVVGSVDLNANRWDEPDHVANNPLRQGDPSHELAVAVRGPAVRDIALTFIERWNDSSETVSTKYVMPDPEFKSSNAVLGTCSIQALRTYPQSGLFTKGYSWKGQGEFTIWCSYLKAIRTAQKFIYIEDQFFLDWGLDVKQPDKCAPESTFLFEALADALKRKVDIIVLVPLKTEEGGNTALAQVGWRNNCVNYLAKISSTSTTENPRGRFIICYPMVKNTTTFVHSKLMIVDDELVLVGSANFCRRSMTCDAELQLAVVDEAGKFAPTLRRQLLAEHLNMQTSDLETMDDLDAWSKVLLSNNDAKGRLYDYANYAASNTKLPTVYPPRIDPYDAPLPTKEQITQMFLRNTVVNSKPDETVQSDNNNNSTGSSNRNDPDPSTNSGNH